MEGFEGTGALVWMFSIVLAIVFVFVGIVLVRDDPVGKKRLGWAETAPGAMAKILGLLMIAGGLCLVVPPLIPGLGWLTPLAGAILAAVMLGIAQYYFSKRNNSDAAPYVLLMLLLVAVVYFRWPLLVAQFG